MNTQLFWDFGNSPEKDIYEFNVTFLVKGLLKAYPKAREVIRNLTVDNVFSTNCTINDRNFNLSSPKYNINSKTQLRIGDTFDRNYYPTISIEGDDVRLVFPSKVITESYNQKYVEENKIEKKLKDIEVKFIAFYCYIISVRDSPYGEYTFSKKDPKLYIGGKEVYVQFDYYSGGFGATPNSLYTEVRFNKIFGFGYSFGNYSSVDSIYYVDTNSPVSFKDIANNVIVIEI